MEETITIQRFRELLQKNDDFHTERSLRAVSEIVSKLMTEVERLTYEIRLALSTDNHDPNPSMAINLSKLIDVLLESNWTESLERLNDFHIDKAKRMK